MRMEKIFSKNATRRKNGQKSADLQNWSRAPVRDVDLTHSEVETTNRQLFNDGAAFSDLLAIFISTQH